MKYFLSIRTFLTIIILLLITIESSFSKSLPSTETKKVKNKNLIKDIDKFIRLPTKLPLKDCLVDLCSVKKLSFKVNDENAQTIKTKFNNGLEIIKQKCNTTELKKISEILKNNKKIKIKQICKNVKDEAIKMISNIDFCQNHTILENFKNAKDEDYGKFALPLYYIIQHLEFNNLMNKLNCQSKRKNDKQIRNYHPIMVHAK